MDPEEPCLPLWGEWDATEGGVRSAMEREREIDGQLCRSRRIPKF